MENIGDKQRTASRIYVIGAPDREGCYEDRVYPRKTCNICGVTYTGDNKWNHRKTKKHLQAVESQREHQLERERKTNELSIHKLSLKDQIKMFPLPYSNSPVSVELPISGHLSYGVVDKLLFYSV